MLHRIAQAYRSAFAGLPRDVWILASAMLVNRSGTMVLPFMSLYLTRTLGFSTIEAGRVLSFYGIGAIAGAYMGGWLADRVGAVRVQQLSLLGTGAGFLLLSQLRDRAEITVAVLAVSMIGEWFRPALFAAAAEAAPPAVRARSLGLLRQAVNLGMSIGPAAGGFLAAHHYRLLFVADALTCWAAAGVLWATMGKRAERRARGRNRGDEGVTSPWRDRPFLAFLALMVLLGTMFFQIMSTFPLYLRGVYHLSEATIGTLLGMNALTIVLVEMVLLRAIEHRNHLLVAGTGGLLVGLGFALMPLGSGVAFAAISVMVWTAGEMLSLPMTNALATMRGSTASAGRYVGAYSVSFSLAFVLAPAVGTTIYQRFGPDVLWFAVGGAGGIVWLGMFVLARTHGRRWAPVESREVEPPSHDAGS